MIKNNISQKLFAKTTLQLLYLPFLVLFYFLLRNAYIIDDAYISFRTVDNFLQGYGLRWNIDERVQAYTHPLWLLLLSGVIYVTGEFHVSAMAVSLLCTSIALLVSGYYLSDGLKREKLWKVCLFYFFFLTSKATLDYSSSGLENPLLYLVMCLFLMVFLDEGQEYRGPWLMLLASCLFCVRMDSLIMVFPALLWVLWREFKRCNFLFGWLMRLFWAAMPALLWLLFALCYYGFILPNTAYAKVANNGLLYWEKLDMGLRYLFHNMVWDYAAYILLVSGWIMAWRKRNAHLLILYIGLFLYIFYVIFSAAAATHMSGRFFAVVHFIGVFLFLYQCSSITTRLKRLVVLVSLLWFFNPGSSLRYGTDSYHAEQLYNSSRIDIKTGIHIFPTAWNLSNWRSDATEPGNIWMADGKTAALSHEKVHIRGDRRVESIGYFGFFAGKDKFVIDKVALSDPLLSKIAPVTTYKAAHYRRDLPEGYASSVKYNRNDITDPDLHEYYEVVRKITRDPVFSKERISMILAYYLGHYDELISRYNQPILERLHSDS